MVVLTVQHVLVICWMLVRRFRRFTSFNLLLPHLDFILNASAMQNIAPLCSLIRMFPFLSLLSRSTYKHTHLYLYIFWFRDSGWNFPYFILYNIYAFSLPIYSNLSPFVVLRLGTGFIYFFFVGCCFYCFFSLFLMTVRIIYRFSFCHRFYLCECSYSRIMRPMFRWVV